MKIVHRISVNADQSDRESLKRLGVSIESGFVSFEVEESDGRWPRLEEWCEKHQAVDDPRTEFSSTELSSADWLALAPEWHCGYPQPDEDKFGYLNATYDLKNFCAACGIGLEQKAPFQMKAEPRWGRRNITQLNWVFDEYFLTTALWQAVFAPAQIPSRPVLNMHGEVMRTVVQLVVETRAVIDTEGLLGQPCRMCGAIKYPPVARGFFPRLKGEPSSSVARTNIYFGSGASANRVVLVSQRIRRELISAGAQGVSMIPIAH